MVAALLLLLASSSHAVDCAALAAQAARELRAHYRVAEMRGLTSRVGKALTAQEKEELSQMSILFNAIPHGGTGIDERIALQKRARRITRTAAGRAGLRPINPEEPSPFDAELGERTSPDGSTVYNVELRSLLVRPDPRPHVTLWVRSSDPVRNPRLIVTVGIAADEAGDYVSWMTPRGRVSASFGRFVISGLPDSCR